MDQTTDNNGAYNKFIVMWCNEGLESVIHLTSNPLHDNLLQVLQDQPQDNTLSHTVWAMKIRAQVNSQRFYEIYTIDAAEGIEKQDIIDLFDTNPQYAADLIRSRGVKIYGERMSKQRVVIT